jgi:hypothetical protein
MTVMNVAIVGTSELQQKFRQTMEMIDPRRLEQAMGTFQITFEMNYQALTEARERAMQIWDPDDGLDFVPEPSRRVLIKDLHAIDNGWQNTKAGVMTPAENRNADKLKKNFENNIKGWCLRLMPSLTTRWWRSFTSGT